MIKYKTYNTTQQRNNDNNILQSNLTQYNQIQYNIISLTQNMQYIIYDNCKILTCGIYNIYILNNAKQRIHNITLYETLNIYLNNIYIYNIISFGIQNIT